MCGFSPDVGHCPLGGGLVLSSVLLDISGSRPGPESPSTPQPGSCPEGPPGCTFHLQLPHQEPSGGSQRRGQEKPHRARVLTDSLLGRAPTPSPGRAQEQGWIKCHLQPSCHLSRTGMAQGTDLDFCSSPGVRFRTWGPLGKSDRVAGFSCGLNNLLDEASLGRPEELSQAG